MKELSSEVRKDIKFYTSLFLGFSLLLIGCFIEPPGQISSSVLMGSGMIFTITAGIIGIDLSKIIKEFRFLQSNIILSEEEKNEIKQKYIEEFKKKG